MNAIVEAGVGNVARELARLFALQRSAFAAQRYPGPGVRQDRLARLQSLVRDNEARFVDAVSRDFGHRSAHETRLAEDEFAVILGDAEVGCAFTELPFDHLFFTGSTAVGRHVARQGRARGGRGRRG